MRILITGSRAFTDRDAIGAAIVKATQGRSYRNQATIVHGACPSGADAIASEIADQYSSTLRNEPHPADWNEYGKPAGMIRNAQMVALGADVCFAFFKEGAGNKGTTHCAELAEKAGIPVVRFTEPA